MSETLTPLKANDGPKATHLKDYQVPSYLIDQIDLSFDLYEEETIVSSCMRVCRNPLSRDEKRVLQLYGEALVLLSVELDGKQLSASCYQVTPQGLEISGVPDNFELRITTKIYPQKNTELSGLYRSQQTYCTQCESEGFRRITYFLDRPDVLARYTTTISADEKKYPTLLSNGNLIDQGKGEKGRHWVKWEDPFKKPSYLFALVAGDFDLLEDRFVTQSGREVVIRIYTDKGYGDQTGHAMNCIKEAMKWDEITFGCEYDLDIYMVVAIGDFNMGAMENKGLNIFNTKYILAKPETATDDDFIHILSVIGHEYFHNWSGNRVTCRDWFQLSLKEGLTIFRDQSFTEDVLSRAVMRIRDVSHLRESQFPEDAGPLAHPVRPESYIEINNFYTATIYQKGAEVLRMLQTILGKPLFRKGMDLYFSKFDGQAVTIDDFVHTMEAVSGMDLTQFREWYSQAGTPTVSVTSEYDEASQRYTLIMQQETAPTLGQVKKYPLFIPIKTGLLNKAGQTIQPETVLPLTKSTEKFEFHKIAERPIPSLLRGFSAPVKLHYPYTDAELVFLFKHDSDAFNRWEAGQTYLLKLLLSASVSSNELVSMYEYVLTHEHGDLFLLSEMLAIPSEKYIGEQMQVIDVDRIHASREMLIKDVATQLQQRLIDTYRNCHQSGQFVFDMASVGKRALKNTCLSYLLRLPEHANLGLAQFTEALSTNMTDTLAALSGLSNLESPLRQQVLDEFYSTWKHDALVVDKWLAIQAACRLPGTLERVKALTQHPAFDIKNPNKVYALISTFAYRNAVHFHVKSGAGYVFLREFVQQLDSLNPQIAARMVNPLTSWKRYDKERQHLMRHELEILLKHKQLSPNVYELVAKSLE